MAERRRITAADLRDGMSDEARRAMVFHEAGHAAMMFAFGNHDNIEHIDVWGGAAWAGRVRLRAVLDPVRLMAAAASAGELNVRIFDLMVKREVLCNLTGFAAEHRTGLNDLFGHWLDGQIEEPWEWEADPGDGQQSHDMARVLRLAKANRSETGGAWRFIRQMAAWTDEALAHPRLWSVVEALGEALLATKRRMAGARACRIMEQAWGGGCLPIAEMGPKWRRRFAIKRS